MEIICYSEFALWIFVNVISFSATKDSKVNKAVLRILSIWEERSVYSEEFISQLRNGLVQKEEPVKGLN